MQTYSLKRVGTYPILCNIPHGSTRIPLGYRGDFRLSQADLRAQAMRLADLFSSELYDGLLRSYGGIVSTISRMVVDVERFEDDRKEVMAKVGMGVLYTKSGDGSVIRSVSKIKRSTYLSEIYRPYHQALDSLIEACLAKHGKCLILDCHTFSSSPRPYEADRKRPRPDICLGTDSLHTPDHLKVTLKQKFKAEGFTVKQNSPYTGAMIPKAYYGKDGRVHSVMIEINRALYMDEERLEKKADFGATARTVCRIIRSSCEPFLANLNEKK